MFPYSPQTVFRHGEVGLSLYPGTQDMLNAPQEVIGLQNEHQLPWHSVQELGDFRQEDGDAATDCTELKKGGRGCRSGGGKPLSLRQTEMKQQERTGQPLSTYLILAPLRVTDKATLNAVPIPGSDHAS